MEALTELVNVLENNPDCLIYYHNQGDFVIYKSKEAWQELENIPYGKEYREFARQITLFDGSDRDGFNGYIPLLVEALAITIGLECESA
jgi:O6-methylguanine-DNA--protein-cysteine methyltransferase